MEANYVQVFVPLLAAIVGGLVTSIFYWRKVRTDLRGEFQKRYNERRWELYARFAESVRQLLFVGDDYPRAMHEFMRNQSRICGELWIVASDAVLKAYNRIGSQTSFGEGFYVLMEVLNEMRKDLGYDATGISPEDMLAVVGIESVEGLTRAFEVNWRSSLVAHHAETEPPNQGR